VNVVDASLRAKEITAVWPARSVLTLDEIASLDLPLITIDALKRLKPFLDQGRLPPQDCTASFQYFRGKNWVEDEISPAP